MSPSPKFSVTWRVNGEVTYILENITAEMVWEEAAPGEAFQDYPNNRWHIYTHRTALERMEDLFEEESFKLAWQDPSTDGSDIEEITVARI